MHPIISTSYIFPPKSVIIRIFLSKLNIIEPALSLFEEIIVPCSVYDEIIHKFDNSAELLNELKDKMNISICKAENHKLYHALARRLGKGESETITIAIEKFSDAVILDDHAARIEALRLGLEVKGTLGIIKKLLNTDKYQCDIEELYRILIKMNFHVKKNIFLSVFY